jgi:O-acetylhomoserine/O-acetylserine sulfhydrylase-like pyridoxal-dependent enzyme
MKHIKILPILLLSIFLFSCASAPERVSKTASGKPEVVINFANVDEIKAQIISDRLNDGYMIANDTPFLLELQRRTKGNEDFAAYFAVGNAYSTNYRTISVNFIKSNESVRIVVASYLKAHMPFGQVNTSEITSNNVYNLWQKYLNNLKHKFEDKNTDK